MASMDSDKSALIGDHPTPSPSPSTSDEWKEEEESAAAAAATAGAEKCEDPDQEEAKGNPCTSECSENDQDTRGMLNFEDQYQYEDRIGVEEAKALEAIDRAVMQLEEATSYEDLKDSRSELLAKLFNNPVKWSDIECGFSPGSSVLVSAGRTETNPWYRLKLKGQKKMSKFFTIFEEKEEDDSGDESDSSGTSTLTECSCSCKTKDPVGEVEADKEKSLSSLAAGTSGYSSSPEPESDEE
jgi:hypothetical protein